MIIQLKDLGPEGFHLDRRIPLWELGERQGKPEARRMDDLPFREEVHLQLGITPAGERYHLRGSLEAELNLDCGRCLRQFAFAVAPAFDYYLVPRRPVEEWAEVEIDEDSRQEVEVDLLELDLLHLVEEQVRLALPMKPLCSEACRGLCPGCGVDLNSEACRCPAGPEDPRLSGLSSILERMKKP